MKMEEQQRESKVKNTKKHNKPDETESEMNGKNLADAPDLVKAVNPETSITQDDPPFFIQHGMVDHLVPSQQSVNLAKTLAQVLGNEKVSLEILNDQEHGVPAFSTTWHLTKVFLFLDTYIK